MWLIPKFLNKVNIITFDLPWTRNTATLAITRKRETADLGPAPSTSAGPVRRESTQTLDICPQPHAPHSLVCGATTLQGVVGCLISLTSCSSITAAITLSNKTRNTAHICRKDSETLTVTEASATSLRSLQPGRAAGSFISAGEKERPRLLSGCASSDVAVSGPILGRSHSHTTG